MHHRNGNTIDAVEHIALVDDDALVRGRGQHTLAGGTDGLLVHRLIAPVIAGSEGVNVVCQEDKFEALLTLLARHELDVVLSDVPLSSQLNVRAFPHPLGESTVSVFAASNLAPKFRRNFPASLDRAAFALPTAGASLRRQRHAPAARGEPSGVQIFA